jgi:beta-glucosidase
MTVVPTGVRSDESGLVARLTLEQKVHLLTGADSWALHGESAVGLRPLLTSDGPAGVRGTRFDPSNPSTSLPCPIAIAATWDVNLVEELATALGQEARSKGVDVLLAPTMNIIRTPLSGRGFECFSEDPLLTSRIAVAYVRGVQGAGVGATAKHYVANDSETERRSYVARISEGVLRELYLPPFEACVGEAGVFLVMAAYNAVNGPTMTANAILLHDVLKADWGFTGVVISDWSATTTTVPSALAGLDLVMPGPDGPWGDKLVAAVRNGAVPESEIDDKVSRIFSLARRLGGFNGSLTAPAPQLVDSGLLSRVTSRSFVLLSNRRGLLPLKKVNLRSIALIGPNAIEPQTQGGGSVRVLPSVRVNVAESLRLALGQATTVSVHQGCLTGATVPSPLDGTLRDPVSGKPGARLEIRNPAGEVVFDAPIPSSVATWWDGLPEAVHKPGSEVVMRAVFRPETDGPYVLGAAGAGRMRVTVNGTVLAEASSLFPGEVVEALGRPPELRVPISLEAGRELDVRVDYRPEKRFVTLRLGIAPQRDDEELIEEAARAADDSDVAVVVIGSAEGTESEGYDKDTMVLPGRQDELVRRVAAANPNTIVVVNSGMPVLMPWADQVAAVIQVWFPGQAFGEALAETLLGIAEPAGRLPVTVPREEADSPVLRARPDAGDLVYREGLLVGYRGYDRTGTEPHFAFGHGLGYTDWTYESLSPDAEAISAGEDVTCAVTVRNSGKRAGREVVQVYLEAADDDPRRPVRVLAAFGTVDAEVGAAVVVRLTLPGRSFARFDEATRTWVWRPGIYTLRAGRSSRDLRLSSQVVMR